MQTKTISAVVRVSCMVVVVKGCLGRQRYFFVELYRLVGGTWRVRGWKVVPRYPPTGDSLSIRCGIVGGKQSLDGQ